MPHTLSVMRRNCGSRSRRDKSEAGCTLDLTEGRSTSGVDMTLVVYVLVMNCITASRVCVERIASMK